MGGLIYLILVDGQLTEMTEQQYESEELLQVLLAQYPNLLSGDQINQVAPRRWLLISREAPIPGEEGGSGRWAVDHLFLDQDGIPTLVEVKRSTDTRIRREVIGQMLDYAANAVAYWPVEQLQARLESTCQKQGQEADQVLSEFLDPDADPAEFWGRVKTNLQAGKVRMLFVADKIPPELQRVVEFLNEQMDPAEVLGLEIKQFLGQSVKTMVPRIIGQSAVAEQKKTSGSRQAKQWDESSFFEDLQARKGSEVVNSTKNILDWGKNNDFLIDWGKGVTSGSFTVKYSNKGRKISLISVWSSGNINIWFNQLQNSHTIFIEEKNRLELLNLLNGITGISLPKEVMTKEPSISLSVLSEESSLKRFLEILDWVTQKLKNTGM